MSGEVVFAIRPTDRFAIEPKIGGGLTLMTPQVTDPEDPTQKLSPRVPHVSTGIELKYLTLLTDFTVGAGVHLFYLVGPDVVSLAEMLTVRYTF
jgi:hypothetical protein